MHFCRTFTLTAFTVLTIKGIVINALNPQVTIPSGTVVGYYDTALNGRKFAAFEGIPYARPPIGKYRFREPQPIKPWKGTWFANQTVTCLQYDHLLAQTENPVHGEEDCLYVNVYTPELSQTAELDVIVFIHGGCFMFRTSHTNRPHFLMDYPLVFVTLNYRLGPLGFLSTEDDVVPGNNGLKDQVAALKWVQQNIQYFGGNPNLVTLIGHSAGGASVSYHYLSPMSKGLFHRAFIKSGIALAPWAQTEGSLEKAKKLAASVGCNFGSSKEMISCMRYRPATQLVENVKQFLYFLYNPFTPFGPVVEKAGPNSFITETPIDLLHQKKVNDVPLAISAVQAEGLYPGSEFLSKPQLLAEIENRWEELAPFLFDYNYTVPKTEHAAVAQKIKSYYLKDEPVSRDTFDQLIQAIGDRHFVAPLELGAKLFASAMKSSVYFAYFTYRGDYSNSIVLSRNSENLGVCHGDDLIYAFNYAWIPELVSEDDKFMRKLVINNWLNFGKTGILSNDTIRPLPVTKTGPLNYAHLETPKKIVVKTIDTFSHRQFWNSLPFKENKVTRPIRIEL